MKTGLFAGSFDPFTIGHANIVERALKLFDHIVIGVGVNDRKPYMVPPEQRTQAVKDYYKDDPRIEVVAYTDMTADLAHRVGAQFIITGVRNTSDFEYERTHAAFNRKLGDIETVILFTEPHLENVSSSAVRELMYFGKPTDEYLPKKK